ncbi:hypothetical protein Tco_0589288 [Tanacetum coccineum]
MREVSSSSLFMGFSFKVGICGVSAPYMRRFEAVRDYLLVVSIGAFIAHGRKRHQVEQSDGFQAQFAALHAELQETKGLVQARHGGGGDQGSLLPRSMRLDVPKFNGADLESWIFTINEYFTLLATPDEQRLRVVGFNLEGDAAEWFRWMTRNKLVTSWDGFLDSVRNRFGPSKYEDLQGFFLSCYN